METKPREPLQCPDPSEGRTDEGGVGGAKIHPLPDQPRSRNLMEGTKRRHGG